MSVSLLDVQRDAILRAVRDAGRGEWKILVVDDASWKLVLGVVKEDDVLNQKIMTIEQIETRREPQNETDVIYLLSPESHIVECLLADFERRRYRSATLLWTGVLSAVARKRIDDSKIAQEQIAAFQTVDIGWFPRESNVVTFRDPWSLPILFHPNCDNLIRQHFVALSQKIVSVCVSLGEYPKIRYYRPPRDRSMHDANVLCSHLAGLVQQELDIYATYHQDFPPPSTRPRGVLYILDRSIDLMSPLIHEFTYQAMIHDLLNVKEGDKVTYRITVNEGRDDKEDKDVELSEKDRIWIANRHRHMKDTIDRLMGDFQKFMDENPHFTKQDAQGSNSLNAIKDMMAGLPQFQEMKEAYSLHLTMAQESMNIFQKNKLADLASVEQSLATGLDEDHKKPKNVADQVVRLLDEDSITYTDRLRLLTMYLLYRDGLLPSDLSKLLQHAQLNPQDDELISNLRQLGANTTRTLKDPRPKPSPLFPITRPTTSSNSTSKAAAAAPEDDYSLSRHKPALSHLLASHTTNTLSQEIFPYTKPELEPTEDSLLPPGMGARSTTQTSLRTAKPTWATTRTASSKPKQRVIVFMAGGATYSESRACYEASSPSSPTAGISGAYGGAVGGEGKDVYLITSHMLTPALFMRQVRDLSADPRRLGIPALAPEQKVPAWVEEERRAPAANQKLQKPQPPTQQLGNMNLNGGAPPPPQQQQMQRPQQVQQPSQQGVPRYQFTTKEDDKKEKKSKMKKLFGSKG